MSDRFITNAILRRNKRRRIRRLSHLRFRLRTMVILTTLTSFMLAITYYNGSNFRDHFANLQTLWPHWRAWDVLPIPCLFLAAVLSVGLCFLTFRFHPSRGWMVSLIALGVCLGIICFVLYDETDVRLHKMVMKDVSAGHLMFALAVPSLVMTPLGSLAGWLAALQEHMGR